MKLPCICTGVSLPFIFSLVTILGLWWIRSLITSPSSSVSPNMDITSIYNFRSTVSRMLRVEPYKGLGLGLAGGIKKIRKSKVEVDTIKRNSTNTFNDSSIPLPTLRATELIKCNNQTKCIQPYIQLKKNFNVYYCKHKGQGVRFYYLVREGLLLHPRIRMVKKPKDADVIVYLSVSSPWKGSECNKPELRTKTVVMDEGDYPQLFETGDREKVGDFALYFKRSYVTRRKGVFKGYMHYIKRVDVLPMSYSIADAYVRNSFNTIANRDIDILCTLRGAKGFDPTRMKVRQWVEEYGKARGVKKCSTGEVNQESRRTISKGYFNKMQSSKIIVTSNPSDWEGDFRLCEALASGALVLVDQMYTPRQYEFITDKHLVIYDINNKTDLFEKLDLYRIGEKKEMARKVAVGGYLHAMRYHRAANLIDYVFRTLHVKQHYEAMTTHPNKGGITYTYPFSTETSSLSSSISSSVSSNPSSALDMLNSLKIISGSSEPHNSNYRDKNHPLMLKENYGVNYNPDKYFDTGYHMRHLAASSSYNAKFKTHG